MSHPHLDDLSSDAPPVGLEPPLQALWWLKKGHLRGGVEWETAHAICQTREGEQSHDLVHALAHLIEGDHANAAYWYRRAGDAQVSSDPRIEWERIVGKLLSEGN